MLIVLEPKWQQLILPINRTPDVKSRIYANELKQYKYTMCVIPVKNDARNLHLEIPPDVAPHTRA